MEINLILIKLCLIVLTTSQVSFTKGDSTTTIQSSSNTATSSIQESSSTSMTITNSTSNSKATSSSKPKSTMKPATMSNHFCEKFVRYDPVNDPKGPELYGFVGGISLKNNVTKQYVGYGGNCYGAQVPGYIEVNSSKPGFYYVCGSNLTSDNYPVFYLLSHPNLTWVSTDINYLHSLSNALKIIGSSPYFFGRTLYNGNYQVGRVYSSAGLDVWINGSSKYFHNFEVLTCSTGSISCGELLDLKSSDPRNSSTLGLLSGIFSDGSPIYPGVGVFEPCGRGVVPGTLLISSKTYPIGTYSACSNDSSLTVDNSPKYFYAHENLQWVSTNTTSAENVPNVVMFFSGVFVARFNFRLGVKIFQTIGIFWPKDSTSRFWMGENVVVTQRFLSFDVLACPPTTERTTTSSTSTTTKPRTTSTTKKTTTKSVTTSTKALNTTRGGPTFSMEKFTTRRTTKRTTTTTTLSTSTTPFYSTKCGEFMRFDPTSSDIRKTRPDIYGFAGGVEFDGSTQYVGYGNNRDCIGQVEQNPCPGYVASSSNTPSVKMSCQTIGMTSDTKNASFLLNHQNLKWLTTDIDDMLDQLDALRIQGPYFKFMFGRIMYRRQYRLGKVQLQDFDSYSKGFYMTDENYKTKFFTSGFQILVCTKCKNGGAGKFCCLNGANNPDCCANGGSGPNCDLPCGTFVPYDTELDPKAPEVDGFAGGISFRDNRTKQYVGYGSGCNNNDHLNDQIISPGYILTTKESRGCILLCDSGEVVDRKTPFYLLSHKNLAWYATNSEEVMRLPSALRKISGSYPLMFGRTFSDGNYLLGKISASYRDYKFSVMTSVGEKILDRDFEVLTCKTNLHDLPCGSFLPYDPVNDPKAPEVNGFAGGISFKDNKAKQYVGYGGSSCFSEKPVVGYIETSSSQPGFYYLCYSANYDNSNAFYLVSHPNLTWIPSDKQKIKEIPDALKVFGVLDSALLMIGRMLYNGIYRVGKVSTQYSALYLEIRDDGFESGFEVLSCSKDTNYACGTFFPYDPVNYRNGPEIFGFAGGISYKDNKTKQYVGYGGSCNNQSLVPCSIETTPSKAGCYMPCDQEVFDNKSAFYLFSHPDLTWIPTNTQKMMKIPDALKINSTVGAFMFGRVLYKGNYQLGKIYAVKNSFGLRIMTKEGLKTFESGFEVLSCSSYAEPQCGASKYYNLDSEPESRGVEGGKNQDGTKWFVGYAENQYNGNIKTPCVIIILNMGCYDVIDSSGNFYSNFLLFNQKLAWIRNDLSTLLPVSSLVSLTTKDKNIVRMKYFFGRVPSNSSYIPGRIKVQDGSSLMLESTVKNRATTGFEILACLPVPNAPCGTFIAYNAEKTPKAPEVDGFAGGISSRDNKTKQYVGYGGPCGNFESVPGYIDTTTLYQGVYFSCNDNTLDNQTPLYLLKHPNLTWIPTDTTKMMKIPDAVPIYENGVKTWMFGRFKHDDQYRLGSIYTSADESYFQVQTKDGILKIKEGFEVLSCSSRTEPPCGTFVQYNVFSSSKGPELDGFEGGVHLIDNKTKQYVGYGKSCFTEFTYMPGYIDTTPENPGCFLPCDKEKYDDQTAFYLQSHPKLTWIKTDVVSMLKLGGTLKLTGGGPPLMFGRVMFKGNYRIGVIHATEGSYIFQFQGPDGLKVYTKGFEVLACSP